MASGFSDFLEVELLDHVFGAATYSAPATTYIAIYTAAPSDAGGGTEVTGGSYARVAFTNNKTNWGDAASGAITNDVLIDFGTASANWGTVVAMAILDASSGGNFLAWGDLTASKVINSGDSATFPVGDLDITLT